MKRVGLIVNPVAGMGGKVGLKGTDGPEIVAQARSLGACPEAGDKARQALQVVAAGEVEFTLYTCPGDMGEDTARACGLVPRLLGQPAAQSTFEDTERAARAMAAAGLDLLLFAGGDGTARNIYHALGEDSPLPVIGIPAGVKIHSAVYATSPCNAGELALLFLTPGGLPLRRAEVMDIDEEAFRQGRLSARLYGYLPVPESSELMQHLKVGGPESEASILEGIADYVVEKMERDTLYIIGPGSTTEPIMKRLGLENTLLGVDAVLNGKLVAADANERQLLELVGRHRAVIVVTVIGGQGYVFGRGNQQISAAVIKAVGRQNIIVVATRQKILALEQGHLLADTGSEELNQVLAGYYRIITGYREELIYRLT